MEEAISNASLLPNIQEDSQEEIKGGDGSIALLDQNADNTIAENGDTESQSFMLGNQIHTFDIEDCNFYDSFAIPSAAGKPIQFSVGHFAVTQNKEPEISPYPFYYKILLVVEDLTYPLGTEDRLVAICQFYRFSQDKNIQARKKHSKFELFRTNILEEVPLANFMEPVLVFEGFASVPKGHRDGFFQHLFYDEKTEEMHTSLPDKTYIGQLQLPTFLQKTFSERYRGQTQEGSAEELLRRYLESSSSSSPAITPSLPLPSSLSIPSSLSLSPSPSPSLPSSSSLTPSSPSHNSAPGQIKSPTPDLDGQITKNASEQSIAENVKSDNNEQFTNENTHKMADNNSKDDTNNDEYISNNNNVDNNDTNDINSNSTESNKNNTYTLTKKYDNNNLDNNNINITDINNTEISNKDISDINSLDFDELDNSTNNNNDSNGESYEHTRYTKKLPSPEYVPDSSEDDTDLRTPRRGAAERTKRARHMPLRYAEGALLDSDEGEESSEEPKRARKNSKRQNASDAEEGSPGETPTRTKRSSTRTSGETKRPRKNATKRRAEDSAARSSGETTPKPPKRIRKIAASGSSEAESEPPNRRIRTRKLIAPAEESDAEWPKRVRARADRLAESYDIGLSAVPKCWVQLCDVKKDFRTWRDKKKQKDPSFLSPPTPPSLSLPSPSSFSFFPSPPPSPALPAKPSPPPSPYPSLPSPSYPLPSPSLPSPSYSLPSPPPTPSPAPPTEISAEWRKFAENFPKIPLTERDREFLHEKFDTWNTQAFKVHAAKK